MNTFQWSDVWLFLSAFGGISTAIIAYLAFRQLEAMKQSISDAKDWNKINSAFNFLPKSHEFNEIEQYLDSSFLRLIDRTEVLNDEEMERLFSDNDESKEVRIKLKNYLNLIEGFCVAIEIGAVDGDTAKHMYSYKFDRHFEELLPYIQRTRIMLNAPNIYCSFENIVMSWRVNTVREKKY